MARRVLITGIGAISPAGIGLVALWEHLITARSVFIQAPPELSAAGAPIVGRVSGLSGASYLRNERHARVLNRHFELLLAAGALAAADASFDAQPIPPARLSVLAGIGPIEQHTTDLLGAMREAIDAGGVSHFAETAEAIHPLRRLRMLPNIGAGLLSIEHRATGPSLTFVDGHGSGLRAVSEAARMIAEGRIDAALCGGADSQLTALGVRMFGEICPISRSTDPQRACRPFDRDRCGVVPAEGAVILVLEADSSAQARGVRAYGQLASTASARAAEGGFRASMPRALAAATCTTADVVVAHGDGGLESDREEALALGTVSPRSITSLQATVGHTMTVCGALNLAVGCLVLQHDLVPSIPSLSSPAWSLPFCRQPTAGRVTSVLVNARDASGSTLSALVRR